MGKLKVLPDRVANMIAAGEVVQRPASVVKELMENAIDAGAGKIEVEVVDAGRTLLRVVDDGCGMSPSDAVLCFERHATSKISSAEDLDKILTYGFRGEALASIAAVAEVTLRTKRAEDEIGVQVQINGAGEVKSSSVAAPTGSNFAIRSLFYNTPARRKFLKSDNIELKHIIEEFTKVALTRPDVEFRLSSSGREVFLLRKAKSLKFRIQDILGSGSTDDIVDLEAETAFLKISGFVGRPDTAKKTAGRQYFFVNGRFFRSAYLHKAVMKAYEDLIPEGVTPSYFIFLSIDPESVDVNIHPAKTEVKFEDESLVFQTLYACIKETLGRNSFGASIDFDTEGAVPMPSIGRSFEQYKGDTLQVPMPKTDSGYDPFRSYQPPVNREFENEGGAEALFENNSYTENGLNTLIVKDKYIVTPAASGVMVVNISRARERILYEQTLKALESDTHITQTALFPVNVRVGADTKLLFEDKAELLTKLGFDISPLGVDTIVVSGVPEGYSCEEGRVEALVGELTDILSEESTLLPELTNQRLARKMALAGAAGAKTSLSRIEACRLIDTLFASGNAELTPGGRRIVSIISIGDLDKLF